MSHAHVFISLKLSRLAAGLEYTCPKYQILLPSSGKMLGSFPTLLHLKCHVGTIRECLSSSQVICWKGGVIVNAESNIQFRNKCPMSFSHAFPNPTDWCNHARPFLNFKHFCFSFYAKNCSVSV
jgi:hypothetical protein